MFASILRTAKNAALSLVVGSVAVASVNAQTGPIQGGNPNTGNPNSGNPSTIYPINQPKNVQTGPTGPISGGPAPTNPAPVANPAPVGQGTVQVAGSTWKGTENLGGFGALTFQFNTNGEAIMIDSKTTVKGQYKQNGNEVILTFGNCVYRGLIQNQSFSGTAYYTQDPNQSWGFAVNLLGGQPANPAPVGNPAPVVNPAPAPAPAVVAVANSTFAGTENLQGFSSLTFEFQGNGEVIMIDAKDRVKGSYTQNGSQVVIRFSNCVYVGQLQGNALVGMAAYGENPNNQWSFHVTKR